MFQRISQAAEQAAMHVSRRAALGQLGHAALAVVGVLAFSVPAIAGGRKHRCCYQCYDGRGDFYFRSCSEFDGACGEGGGPCWLIGEVSNCKQCWSLV